MKPKSSSDIAKLFKSILKEAAKTFAKDESQITRHQFLLVANGRLGDWTLKKYGGYSALRECVAPAAKKKTTTEELEAIKRILKSA